MEAVDVADLWEAVVLYMYKVPLLLPWKLWQGTNRVEDPEGNRWSGCVIQQVCLQISNKISTLALWKWIVWRVRIWELERSMISSDILCFRIVFFSLFGNWRGKSHKNIRLLGPHGLRFWYRIAVSCISIFVVFSNLIVCLYGLWKMSTAETS